MMAGLYYTPAHILDFACGTGGFLTDILSYLLSNPPYGEVKA